MTAMMYYKFVPMTRSLAETISTWKYPEPYHFYNFQANDDCVQELLNEEYVCAFNEMDMLMGFFCYGHSARVPGGYETGIYERNDMLDIGLGMEPSQTGRGMGNFFVVEGLRYMKRKFKQHQYRLVVAYFNQRAINVYRKNGFMERTTFISQVNGVDVEFVCMTLEDKEE